MTAQRKREFRKRTIVHLAEGRCTPRLAKTTRGVLIYSPHQSVGIIDSTNIGRTAQQLLGGGGDIPVVASMHDLMHHKPDTLVVGVTPVGGQLPSDFRRHIIDALEMGIDVWSGMHQFLADDKEFQRAAEIGGSQIWDVRRPPHDLPVGHGHMINCKSLSVLMVGTDCALGKMTAGLEIQRALQGRETTCEFVSTGQTGMMITGWGHPIDAIAGDFMAGCVEKDCMSVDGHCDTIITEGQGSLMHPGYAPVTLALMHGSMPDAMIMCHQPSRLSISNREHVRIPHLNVVMQHYLDTQAPLKPSKFIGICLNTYGMDEASARQAVETAERETGLPATDPVRFGSESIADAIEACRRDLKKGRSAVGVSS